MKHLLKVLILSVVLLPLLAACGDKNETRYLAVKIGKSEKWSIIDIKDGSIVVEDEFENAPTPIVNDRFFVENKKNEMELYNVKDIDNPIETYKKATPFRDGRAIVSPDGKKLEIIDTDGEVVETLPKSYKKASAFYNEYACVAIEKDGKRKWGYINTDGEEVIKPTYDGVSAFSEDHYAVVVKFKEGDDYGWNASVINDNGEKQFSFSSDKYDNLASDFFQNGSIALYKGDKVVYVDKDGQQILKAGDAKGGYGVYGLYKGMTVYADGDNFGVKDEDGEKVLKAKYKYLRPIENGKFIARKDDKCMIIDKEGEQITKDEYFNMVKITEDRFLVKESERGNWILIDEEGNEIGDETFSEFVPVDIFSGRAYTEISVNNDNSSDSSDEPYDEGYEMSDSVATTVQEENYGYGYSESSASESVSAEYPQREYDYEDAVSSAYEAQKAVDIEDAAASKEAYDEQEKAY